MTESETKERYKIHERFIDRAPYFFVYDTKKPFPDCIYGCYVLYSLAQSVCDNLNQKREENND